MNTLERLKTEARDELKEEVRLLVVKAWREEQSVTSAVDEIMKLIEHTHTQTIQSVRERVKKLRPQNYLGRMGYMEGYDNALDDLLKDLEAPVEGDGV